LPADLALAPAWVTAPDLRERTLAAADVAAIAWGGNLTSTDDTTVAFSTDHYLSCAGSLALGCNTASYDLLELREAHRIEISVWSRPTDLVTQAQVLLPCVEASILAHEIGHSVIGDDDHRDPRWCDREFWEKVTLAMLRVVPKGDRACLNEVLTELAYTNQLCR
jgi:hypothetical protein